MNIFYHPEVLADSTAIVFSKDESRHIAKVLRKSIGDYLYTTNGKGVMLKVKLEDVDHKKCTASVIEIDTIAKKEYKVHMVVAPTKLNDRFEWFLEKATEIGVSEITPVFCDHSERLTIKEERYQKIVVSAMKQSLQAHLPILNKAISFRKFLELEMPISNKFIAHCEQGSKKLLQQCVLPTSDVTICIGPEGDFSSEEIELAIDAGFTPVSLGDNRLRTETAAIVACHTIALVNQTDTKPKGQDV